MSFSIFKKLKSIEVVKVFSFNFFSFLIKIISNLVIAKVVAVAIGPSGLALIGQLQNFTQSIQVLGSGGINKGVVKYVSEFKNDKIYLSKILGTSTKISIVLSLFLGVGIFFLSNTISLYIFNTNEFSIVFNIFGLSLVFFTINNQFLSIINGFGEHKKFIKLNIFSSIVGLAFTLLLIYYADLKGALIAMVSYQSILVFYTYMKLKNSPYFNVKFLFGSFNKLISFKLFNYSLMIVVTALIGPFSLIFIRNFIISELSLTDAGIWEGINKISRLYLMLITSSLAIYYLPKISGLKKNNEIRKEIFLVYKLVIPISLILILFIFLLKEYIILIIFTTDFSSMIDLFKYQLFGDLFKILSWVLSFIMIAKAQTKKFLYTEIIFTITFILLNLILIKFYNLKGASIAYMINYICYFITMIVLFKNIVFNQSK